MYALNLSKNGRILSATEDEYAPPEQPRVEQLPTGETAKEKDISNWLYVDGQYEYDPLPDPEPPEPSPSIEQLRADVDYIAMVEDIDLEG